MIFPTNRGRLVFVMILLGVVGFIGVQMFYGLTPPRHADHDHAMSSLNAGGFLRIEAFEGGQRNLVGTPGHVLILYFFDPRAANAAQQTQVARMVAGVSNDPAVETLFVARTHLREGLDSWAQSIGISPKQIYLDEEGRTSNLLGVRRWPETLIYSPNGLLAYQAKSALDQSAPELAAQINRAKAGVEEIH